VLLLTCGQNISQSAAALLSKLVSFSTLLNDSVTSNFITSSNLSVVLDMAAYLAEVHAAGMATAACTLQYNSRGVDCYEGSFNGNYNGYACEYLAPSASCYTEYNPGEPNLDKQAGIGLLRLLPYLPHFTCYSRLGTFKMSPPCCTWNISCSVLHSQPLRQMPNVRPLPWQLRANWLRLQAEPVLPWSDSSDQRNGSDGVVACCPRPAPASVAHVGSAPK
jgi:hypothetical protein